MIQLACLKIHYHIISPKLWNVKFCFKHKSNLFMCLHYMNVFTSFLFTWNHDRIISWNTNMEKCCLQSLQKFGPGSLGDIADINNVLYHTFQWKLLFYMFFKAVEIFPQTNWLNTSNYKFNLKIWHTCISSLMPSPLNIWPLYSFLLILSTW